MDKKKCETWNNFEVVDGEKAKCNFCSNTISYKGGSTANLTRYLKRKHIVQYEARKKRSIEILEKNIDEPDNVSVSEPSHSNLTTITPIIKNKTASVTKTQVSIDAYTSRPMPISKSKKIDEQLGIMMAKEYQPFSLVENKEFKKFVSLLNPSYSLPSRKTITYNILPQLLENTREKVKRSLDNASYIAMSTDGWTSVNNESYVAVTVHFIDTELCVLKSHLLGCYYFELSHTAINLSTFLNNCFEEWSIVNKVKIAISDNASNITAAISSNKNWKHIPCLAHSINLIAQCGLEEIKEIHKKVKKIVEHFKRSSQAAAKLKNTQIQMNYPVLKLKQDVITRWNSTYDMFNRCLETKDPLVSTLAMIGNTEMLTASNFNLMDYYCKLFKPFKEVTIELSSEKGVSIS
ncbi:zinc finger BED domain-containing protein 1-like [Sipha flava]|uniref:Zinc finger BED domain-containing protein 1-like n=1 Tax=Sipha flava TaxID=143950 RepID=A0A8B8FK77_9HEMI|nr:zinc finger BED domain-containing protein 1-like [Sipha flava]